MQRALVAGATGYLGRHLAGELKRRRVWVRALVRHPWQRAFFQASADEVFLGQITDPSSLKGVADGVDTVFSTIGITRQKDGLTYEDVDYRGNLNLLNEAANSGVRNFLYVSLFHAQHLREIRLVAAKERFVDALHASSLNSCVIRPTGFFSDMADILAMARKGLIVLIGDGQNRLNPISGHDLAIVCIDAVAARRTDVEAGGPRIYTFNEIASHAFSALKKPARIFHLPGWTAKAATTVLRAFTPIQIYGPFELFLTTAIQEMVAPCYGSDRLEDFFRHEAQAL